MSTFKHGHSRRDGKRTRIYRIWANMMDRCEWGGNKQSWQNYGAKGIRVCDRWRTFANFLADMGQASDELTLDRINNDLGYSPENCRWATRKQQSFNTSRTIRLVHEGAAISVAALCEKSGIKYRTMVVKAHRRGGDYVRAFSEHGICVSIDAAQMLPEAA
jgi:hypothetical protein